MVAHGSYLNGGPRKLLPVCQPFIHSVMDGKKLRLEPTGSYSFLRKNVD
jgi:hypothetical protein